jgi:hypothetical protein
LQHQPWSTPQGTEEEGKGNASSAPGVIAHQPKKKTMQLTSREINVESHSKQPKHLLVHLKALNHCVSIPFLEHLPDN